MGVPVTCGEDRVAQQADVVNLQQMRLVLAQVGTDTLALVLDGCERRVEVGVPLPFEAELVERGIQCFAVGLQDFALFDCLVFSRREGLAGPTG